MTRNDFLERIKSNYTNLKHQHNAALVILSGQTVVNEPAAVKLTALGEQGIKDSFAAVTKTATDAKAYYDTHTNDSDYSHSKVDQFLN